VLTYYLFGFIYPFYWLYLTLRNLPNYVLAPRMLRLDMVLFFYYHVFFRSSAHRTQMEAAPRPIGELTYGETPYFALRRALRWVKPTKTDVFYDLGCGRGKLVFYMNQRFRMKAVGVDVIPEFVRVGNALAKRKGFSNVEFRQADLLSLPMDDATLVFVAGTSLEDDTQSRLFEKLETLRLGAHVITTSYSIRSEKFALLKILRVPFSWGVGHLFVHERVSGD
jgi:SAM-dependent methyltransferase